VAMVSRASPKGNPPLVEGVYEHLVTEALARALEGIAPLTAEFVALDDADAHIALARHVGSEIERVLDELPRKERVEHARAFAATLIEHLGSLASSEVGSLVRDQVPTHPARQLLSLHRASPPRRPKTPLTTSSLLTRSRGEPPLGLELAREIDSADRVDTLIAFVTVSGVNAIRESLHELSRRGGRFRLLTTTFRGVTEVAALDELSRLPGAEVKVSFDVRRTRLHAKAWLFQRATGLDTAYIGSANLTSTALGAGHEWMVKVCTGDLRHVIQQFAGTFETLWADAEFEAYHPDDTTTRARLISALTHQQGGGTPADRILFALRALPFQQAILDKLQAERELHHRRRNLVVAATGTGKTVIAALDYVRQVVATGVAPRLLFLAHRRELLEQARDTFRHALQDLAFGELLVDGIEPTKWEHVFASVQSAASQDLIAKFGAAHFRHVIVDECHHMPARTYQEVVPKLQPEILVGLTATPERSDGKSLLPDFDGHIAAELRLWNALDGQLLVPFEYFGIADGVDLRRLRWSRKGHDVDELAGLYTGNDARADLIRHQLQQRVSDLRQIRALAFCVSVDHAKFMAKRFTDNGVPSMAVFGDSPERDDVKRLLHERTVNVVFVCDLYNEGVDIPFVDTLLFLRPTQSATLFMQQLGRGLRHHPTKTSCLVLDFIGQHRAEFRFDGILSAITGIPRAAIRKAVEEGFPYLPSGCSLQLDRVARDVIVQSLRTSLAGATQLTKELRELHTDGPRPTLASFLEQTGRELAEVYDAGGWTTLLHRAGGTELPDYLKDASRRLGWLQHIDEPPRLRRYEELLQAALDNRPLSLSSSDRASVLMFDAQLQNRGVLRAAESTINDLAASLPLVQEFRELREVLEDRVEISQQVLPVPEWPLALHRHYSRREILAAVGYMQPGEKIIAHQGGILKLDGQRELLFVTLDKSGKGYSPTTRYRDFAISPTLFHWETQGAASVTRDSGKRYVESPGNGSTFFLFVRPKPGEAFAFLGPVEYQTHQGDRPIGITWTLQFAMPANLYDRYATMRPG
jgi:superfamily II DNA or RNA helicase/HKD family nuclease